MATEAGLTTERVVIDTLELHPENARRGDVGAISASLEAHGQYRPIVIQRSTRRIIAGNHTTLAAIALGWTEIDAVFVDVDDEQARRIMVADNRLSDVAYDDPSLLVPLLEDLARTAAGLAGTGWDGDDLDALIYEQRMAADALTFPAGRPAAADEASDPPAVPVTRPGDLWLLGDHRLLCGDATDSVSYGLLLGDARVHMVWTDPPYGVDYDGGQNPISNVPRESLEGDLDTAAYTASLPLIAAAAPDAPLYLWFAGTRGSSSIYGAVERAGYRVNALLIWHKLNAHYGAFMARYMPKHEPFLYATRSSAPWYGPSNEVTVWEYDQPARSEFHPTQKPVALAARAILNSTQVREIALDPFAGSGTLLMACEQEGRKARLMEIDPGYCDVICRRFQEYAGVVPVLERTGEPVSFLEPAEIL